MVHTHKGAYQAVKPIDDDQCVYYLETLRKKLNAIECGGKAKTQKKQDICLLYAIFVRLLRFLHYGNGFFQ